MIRLTLDLEAEAAADTCRLCSTALTAATADADTDRFAIFASCNARMRANLSVIKKSTVALLSELHGCVQVPRRRSRERQTL